MGRKGMRVGGGGVSGLTKSHKASATPGSGARQVTAYLSSLTPDKRHALTQLRRLIKAAVPGAEESIVYGMPSVKLHGRPLAYFAAFTQHCSLFPASTAVLRSHRAKLKGYHISKGTIRFLPEKPLPAAVVRSILRARAAELTPDRRAR